jgi:CubicO group peptidase (beta-lactamase class C family)
MALTIKDYLETGESLAFGRLTDADVVVGGSYGEIVPKPWASVSKLVAAVGVHIGIEDGSLALGSGLGDFDIPVEELLSHASGLATGEANDPRLVTPDNIEPSIAPRTRRIYSNIGYELLGRGLERVSSMAYRDYIREAVFEPAGMVGTSVDPELATTGAAFGLSGTIDDLVKLVRVLSVPSILADVSLLRLRTPFLGELPGVLPGFGLQTPNPWGLGAEVRGHKVAHWMGTLVSEASYGHFGQSGSYLWIDPSQQCFAVFLGAKPFGTWAKERWPSINDAVMRAMTG